METVKLEDVNITVKTLTINGKRITKSIFDQIPFGVFMFYTDDKPIHYLGEAYYDIIGYRTDSVINDKFVAFLNKDIKKTDSVRAVFHFYNFHCCTPDETSQNYYPMLYLNKDGKLRRSYISEYNIRTLKLNEEQIFI